MELRAPACLRVEGGSTCLVPGALQMSELQMCVLKSNSVAADSTMVLVVVDAANVSLLLLAMHLQ